MRSRQSSTRVRQRKVYQKLSQDERDDMHDEHIMKSVEEMQKQHGAVCRQADIILYSIFFVTIYIIAAFVTLYYACEVYDTTKYQCHPPTIYYNFFEFSDAEFDTMVKINRETRKQANENKLVWLIYYLVFFFC